MAHSWNKSLGDFGDQFGSQAQNSSAVMADLDGDNDLEIIIGSWDRSLYVIDHEENLIWTLKLRMSSSVTHWRPISILSMTGLKSHLAQAMAASIL